MYLFWHVSTLSLSSATQRFRTLRTSPSSPDAWDAQPAALAHLSSNVTIVPPPPPPLNAAKEIQPWRICAPSLTL
jgi:hypothetical protein